MEFEDPLFDGLLCVTTLLLLRARSSRVPPHPHVRDDDYRLGFLHGSFITLTNLEPSDWYRLAEQRLSPLYVSVHATEPECAGGYSVPASTPHTGGSAGCATTGSPPRFSWSSARRERWRAPRPVPGRPAGAGMCWRASVVPVGLTRCAPAVDDAQCCRAGEVIAQVTQWRWRYHAAIGRRPYA